MSTQDLNPAALFGAAYVGIQMNSQGTLWEILTSVSLWLFYSLRKIVIITNFNNVSCALLSFIMFKSFLRCMYFFLFWSLHLRYMTNSWMKENTPLKNGKVTIWIKYIFSFIETETSPKAFSFKAYYY